MKGIERETIITLNSGEDTAQVYSCQPRIWNRMRKLGVDPSKIQRGQNGRIVSQTFQVPVKWVVIRKPRVLTEANRVANQAKLVKARLARAKFSPRPVTETTEVKKEGVG